MKSTGEVVPCRLSVILATETSVGVIFRRGPSKWVQIIRWNTDTDAFEAGQWFHGRIYEDRSDLSPDGSKLVYVATKYTNRDEDIGQVWTAISKVPYLTALALFPQNYCGTWYGGGLFLSNHEVCIAAHSAFATRKPAPDAGLTVRADPGVNVLASRFERGGWKKLENPQKSHPTQPFILCITSASGRWRDRSFAVTDKAQNRRFTITGAVWADWDRRGRLVYAKDGKLFAAAIDNLETVNAEIIADFNANIPEPIEAPAWARVW